MNQNNTQTKAPRQFIINEEYVSDLLFNVFDAEFTEEQWEEFFSKGGTIGEVVHIMIEEVLNNVSEEDTSINR